MSLIKSGFVFMLAVKKPQPKPTSITKTMAKKPINMLFALIPDFLRGGRVFPPVCFSVAIK